MITKQCATMLLCAFLLAPCHGIAADKATNKAEVRDKPRINFLISAPHRAATYSCNLLEHSFQCREYDIIPNAKITLEDLHDSCESMGGKFQKVVCPSNDKLSICTEVIRNFHKPDVIYKNVYYTGDQSLWDLETTQRVCTDLGGQWLAEPSPGRVN